MFNDFQVRMASLGFPACPIDAEQFSGLLAAGFDEETIADIASDVASGWTLREACEMYD